MNSLFRSWMLWCLAVCAALAFQGNAHAYIVPVAGVSHFTETTTVGGAARTALWFRPTVTPAGSAKAPLLVMLHYGGGTGESMAFLTEVSLLVRDYGVWVVLPDGLGGKWNNDPGNDTGVDDVGFLNKLIDDAAIHHPVDPKKVYMAGFSNGGFMATRYACEQPRRIAAAAAVSAGLYRTQNVQCSPSPGVPMMMINGTADPIVRYNAVVTILDAPSAARRWASIDGCPVPAQRTNLPNLVSSDKTTVTLDVYPACAQGEVDLYTVTGGGHTWPGSDYNTNLYGATTFDIDGTRAVWEFVRRFTR